MYIYIYYIYFYIFIYIYIFIFIYLYIYIFIYLLFHGSQRWDTLAQPTAPDELFGFDETQQVSQAP